MGMAKKNSASSEIPSRSATILKTLSILEYFYFGAKIALNQTQTAFDGKKGPKKLSVRP
jgi:hypothetical protein